VDSDFQNAGAVRWCCRARNRTRTKKKCKTLPLSRSPSRSPSLSPSPSPFHPPSLSILSVSGSLALSRSLSLSTFRSLSRALSLIMSPSLSLTLSLSLCPSLSVLRLPRLGSSVVVVVVHAVARVHGRPLRPDCAGWRQEVVGLVAFVAEAAVAAESRHWDAVHRSEPAPPRKPHQQRPHHQQHPHH
jgi:hypothetical protein